MSELRKNLTVNKLEIAYKDFMKQAEKNAVSGKSEGKKIPLVLLNGNIFDGSGVLNQYGYGAASKAPHINWWVVSIYYEVESGRIVMGIEEDRYRYFDKLTKPTRYTHIGKKNVRVAVYYEATKNTVDYNELYEKFIDLSEQVMKYGLL
jgi:hypothetical protein